MNKKEGPAPIPDGPLKKGTPTDDAIKAEFERLANELKAMQAETGRSMGRFIYRQRKRFLG